MKGNIRELKSATDRVLLRTLERQRLSRQVLDAGGAPSSGGEGAGFQPGAMMPVLDKTGKKIGYTLAEDPAPEIPGVTDQKLDDPAAQQLYSEDQARESDGRFAGGGGSSGREVPHGVGQSHADTAAGHRQAAIKEAELGHKDAANAHIAATMAHVVAQGAQQRGAPDALHLATVADEASTHANNETRNAESNDYANKGGGKMLIEKKIKGFEKAAADGAQQLYSEDQERDADGRWGGGGTQGPQKSAEHAGTAADHKAASDFHTAQADKLWSTGKRADAAAASAHAVAADAHIAAAKLVDSPDQRAAGYASARAQIASKVAGELTEGRPKSRNKAAADSLFLGLMYGHRLAVGDQPRHESGRFVPGSKPDRAAQIEATHSAANAVAIGHLDVNLRAAVGDPVAKFQAEKTFQDEMTAAKSACDASHAVNGTVHTAPVPSRMAAAAGRETFSHLVAQDLAVSKIEIEGPADDNELPASLRGKGLIKGKPVAQWPMGLSVARDGRRFIVDQRAVASLLADGNAPGTIVPFTYVHEDAAADPENASKNSGYMNHFSADTKFIYSDKTFWTQAAAKDLADGSRGFVSPDAYCEPVDHDTYEPLPMGAKTDTFRPLYWRASSLVPVPALASLPTASLGTFPPAAKKPPFPPPAPGKKPPFPPAKPPVASATNGKEIPMDPEVLAALGFAPGSTPTPEQVKAAILALANDPDDTAPGATPPAPAAPPAAPAAPAAGAPAGGTTHVHIHTAASADPADTDMSAEAVAKRKEKADMEKAKTAAPQPAAAAPATPATPADLVKLVRQEMSADEAKQKIDTELLDFEKKGQLVAADREFYRAMYATDPVKARQVLASRRPGMLIPSDITSGGLDPSISVDNLPVKEAEEILSRAAAFHLEKGVEFPIALAAVRGDDKTERDFHARVLAANPDWGKVGREKLGARGTKWTIGLRRGYRVGARELDVDLLKSIGQTLKSGKVPFNLIPREMQEMALERMKLGGEVSSFQPAAKYGISGFAVGYTQGEYGGSEIALEVTGGANEQAYYPIYGTEKLSMHVGPDGLPEPIGRNAQDIERSYWGVDFKTIILHGYGNRVDSDRRDQSAGDAVLPQGVMATVTEQALTIEKNKKELLQAATLRNPANYNAANTINFAASSRQWNDPASTPIQDWQGARVQIWRATGAFPDVSLVPPDVIETLRFHPDFLKAAQLAGVGHMDSPHAMVPLEMLVSILGPIVTPTARISITPGGAGADTPWGQDVIMAVTSEGKVIAPRAFATVVSSGYPVVRGVVNENAGLIGSDGVIVSDMYSVEVVGPGSPTPTSAAFLFQNATRQLVVAL